MKANELRIGNWLRWKDNDKVWHELRGVYMPITVDNILFFDEDEEKANLLFEPIELTEDILLKCGFERLEPNHDEYPNGGYDLRTVVIYRKGIFTYNTSHGWWINRKHMYSKLTDMELHQLQNLYFAITKEELEVNL